MFLLFQWRTSIENEKGCAVFQEKGAAYVIVYHVVQEWEEAG